MNDARSSTATATTATAEPTPTLIGRFAPSPTGPLHLGSLVAATGSYLDARHQGGRWLVRLEDLDTPRNLAGAEAAILQTLAAFGFSTDGPVVRQSKRRALYESALSLLWQRGLLFRCRCSRREIAEAGLSDEPRCVGDCRRHLQAEGEGCLRVALDSLPPRQVHDRSGREIRFDPTVHTDVVVRRRDRVIAYHLAVVVDDAEQAVSDVVRGGDLLGSATWQLGLQSALSLPTPRYLHLPLVVEPDGTKLAKSRRSVPLATGAAPFLLRRALQLLGQPSPKVAASDLEATWQSAIAAWDPAAASRCAEVPA